MASKTGQPPSGLAKELLESPSRFSFVQAIRLLRLMTGEEESRVNEKFFWNKVRIRPELTLGFPATDITELEEVRDDNDQVRYNLEATFLGLYGTSSPLPTFYTEELLDDVSEGHNAVRDYLDIFNHTFFVQYYKAWGKYRLMFQTIEKNDAETIERLYCLLGLADPQLREGIRDSWKLLRYIGLFTQYPRSSFGLCALLSDMFEVDKVDVDECVLRMVPIPEDQRCRLHMQGDVLGENAILGSHIPDRSGKARILFGPMTADTFHKLLPQAFPKQEVERLVRLYLMTPLELDVELTVKAEEVQPARFGLGQWCQLGCDTWIYSEDSMPSTAHVTMAYNE
ncbi:type VI secretion system baseplate subunit TssG [Halodesulfovibrio sp. MK-HDV]|jgi:type VI secretion system protein ImpH|uniref:type VI secretion system baseplate subunit TssG n=1 Tax=Halodesulfovibrio sp. MK-HDV TaxID=2599925 RepID=UPI00136C6549|nr:type VI secretion system baseplate subunit TssG [Halodesulfovibrio sp. MK-HDV]KAF1077358.1 hypothetical protein MKHDV_00422 [Halodesulfovibrio sp. MK-HDV]